MQPLSMILAIARNSVIGDRGAIPWRISEDMRRFRALTMGHTLIVGRKTWETLPPLAGRYLVVVSRRLTVSAKSTAAPFFALSIKDAIAAARWTDDAPIVIGGAEVYRAALPFVSRIYLTEIDLQCQGDTRFELDRTGFVETERRQGEAAGVSFVVLDRVL